MKKVFIDTNIFLSDNFKIEDYNEISTCITCIEELDGLKKDNFIGYKARRAIKNIENSSNVIIKFNYTYSNFNKFLEHKNDNIILGFAYETYVLDNEYIFLTDDYNLLLKAKAMGLPCSLFDNNKCEEFYKGYKYLQGGTAFINELFDNITNGINEYGFVVNEYLILYNSDLDDISEYRFDGNKFVQLKLPSSKIIKGLNSLQRCALDLLNNKDIGIVSINGMVGSGKTYSCMRMALYHIIEKGTQSKILAVREPEGEGKSIGYLKGSYEDKTKNFFMPIVHSLNGGEFELNSLIQRGVFESSIPYFLKGTTYNDTIIVVDEAEDLSEKEIRLVGTRVGNNSRIFFSGDYKQAIRNNNENNALIKMCNELKGNPSFGCIYLDEDVRSSVSKTFAYLFQN